MSETGTDLPTYFANIVTCNLNADELVMELRRYFAEHKDQDPNALEIPPPSLQEIYGTPPVARVVLTFSAAKWLKEYLEKTIPMMEARRR